MMKTASADASLRVLNAPSEKEIPLILAADYPFLDVLWTMLVFFLWVAWFMLLFHVIGDVFRRRDASGGKKTLWLVFVILVPFLGVFVYLIANSDDMARRSIERSQAAQAAMDDHVRSVAGSGGGVTAEIDRAKQLLDSGAITQAEFEAIKAKALATN
jgi:Phospholipase_D-nuclease N-terminal/Short C-terminal domain